MIDRVSSNLPISPSASAQAQKTSGSESFSSILSAKLESEAQKARTINFSKHALTRAEERGIELTPALVDRLTDSLDKAQEKGATNILALDQTRAFIINVPYGRVITTMSQEEMKDKIFTNIDSAVLL